MGEKSNHIVVIGGTACGPKAAARARRLDQQAKITIVEQGEYLSSSTCGLPYYISGVIQGDRALISRGNDFFGSVLDVSVKSRSKALAINRGEHEVEVLNLREGGVITISYDKLVLATGSVPLIPDIEGGTLGGIFTLTKVDDAKEIRNLLKSRGIKRAVIVGAGLIGMEMTEAFVSQGLEVTVIEALDRVLPALLDFEMAAYVERHMRDNGVRLLIGRRVTRFEGNGSGWVHKVITNDTELEADMVLLAIGNRPNVDLARNAGLSIGATGGISVNQYLQTSDPDIYAGGDCVENVNLITQQKILAPMGSTANKHGRVIGTNVTGGCEEFPGVLSTAIVKVFRYNVARVGLSELQAHEAGYDVITCLVPGFDRANYYPDGKEVVVKLVAEKSSGRLLGGQVAGPGEAAKRIDVLATALTFGATVGDLANLDLAYAPPYNSALDLLHNAANIIRNKQSGYARTITPMELKGRLVNDDDFILLDVRSPGEWEACRIEARQDKLIPISELRARLDELPQNAETVIYCHTGVRAYQVQRILDGAGIRDTRFLDGCIVTWPYEILDTRRGSS